MNDTRLLMNIYCFINGFKVKELKTKSELKAAFDLKNKVNYIQSGLPLLAPKDDFIYPKGRAYILGLFKNKRLIGSIQLLDLTIIAPYAFKLYPNANLDYNPETTYEVKSFVVDTSYQKNIRQVDNLCCYYIKVPKGVIERLTLKFFRMAINKTLNKLKPSLSISQLLRRLPT